MYNTYKSTCSKTQPSDAINHHNSPMLG